MFCFLVVNGRREIKTVFNFTLEKNSRLTHFQYAEHMTTAEE
jgi:hypothetical protein